MSLELILNGIVFRRNGKTVALNVTEQQFAKLLCHIQQYGIHGVTVEGGFVGGRNTAAGRGIAIGYNAKAVSNHGQYLDAIQLGEGTNQYDRTLKVYDYYLLNAEGKIYEERLPDSIGNNILRQKVSLVSDEVLNVDGKIGTYLIDTSLNLVDLILPAATTLENLSITFKLAKQGVDQYAFKIERSGEDIIMVDGEERVGISCDRLGSYFTLVVSDGVYYVTTYSSIEDLHNVE